jgi:hypothetical protein
LANRTLLLSECPHSVTRQLAKGQLREGGEVAADSLAESGNVDTERLPPPGSTPGRAGGAKDEIFCDHFFLLHQRL